MKIRLERLQAQSGCGLHVGKRRHAPLPVFDSPPGLMYRMLKCASAGPIRRKQANMERFFRQMDAPADNCDASPCDLARVQRFAFGVALALAALWIVGAYAYATRGGPLVDRLVEANGDVMVRKARIAVRAGNLDEADALYAQAIAGVFPRRQLKIWAMEEYVRFLADRGDAARAVPIMAQVVEEDPRRASAYDLLVQTLTQAGDRDRARNVAGLWAERMREYDDADGLEWAERVARRLGE